MLVTDVYLRCCTARLLSDSDRVTHKLSTHLSHHVWGAVSQVSLCGRSVTVPGREMSGLRHPVPPVSLCRDYLVRPDGELMLPLPSDSQPGSVAVVLVTRDITRDILLTREATTL